MNMLSKKKETLLNDEKKTRTTEQKAITISTADIFNRWNDSYVTI